MATSIDPYVSSTADAQRAIDNADYWMNMDGNMQLEDRAMRASVQAQLAQAHATLAVANRLDKIIELVFDEARAIQVTQQQRYVP